MRARFLSYSIDNRATFTNEELSQIRTTMLKCYAATKTQGRLISDIEGEVYTRLCQELQNSALNGDFHGRQKNWHYQMGNAKRKQLMELIASLGIYNTNQFVSAQQPQDELGQMKLASDAAAKAAEAATKAVASTDLVLQQLAELKDYIEGDR